MKKSRKELLMGLQMTVYVAITAIPLSLLFPFADTSWGCFIGIITGPSTPVQALFMAIFGHFALVSKRGAVGWGIAILFHAIAHVWFYSGEGVRGLPARTMFYMVSWLAIICFSVRTPPSEIETLKKTMSFKKSYQTDVPSPTARSRESESTNESGEQSPRKSTDQPRNSTARNSTDLPKSELTNLPRNSTEQAKSESEADSVPNAAANQSIVNHNNTHNIDSQAEPKEAITHPVIESQDNATNIGVEIRASESSAENPQGDTHEKPTIASASVEIQVELADTQDAKFEPAKREEEEDARIEAEPTSQDSGKASASSPDNKNEEKPVTKSGGMPLFIFGVAFSTVFYMFNGFWPNYGLGLFGILVYVAVSIIWVIVKIRGKRVENDQALLLIQAYTLNGFSLSLMLLYNLNPLLGPLVTNAIILAWGLFIYQVVFKIAVKITTPRDAYLWMYPISFALNLVQMVLFTDSLSTKERFGLMILLQEAQSIFTNTGSKDWVIHKVKVRLGRQGSDKNPFHNKDIFHDIASRASINNLSEFAALAAVFVAVIGEHVAMQLGASGKYCTTICARDPRDVLVRLSIVWAVKVVVLFAEHRLTRYLIKRDHSNEFLSRLSRQATRFTLETETSKTELPSPKPKRFARLTSFVGKDAGDLHSSFVLLVAMSVTTTIEILTIDRNA